MKDGTDVACGIKTRPKLKIHCRLPTAQRNDGYLYTCGHQKSVQIDDWKEAQQATMVT